jgi:hypothetical protein
LGRQRLAKSQRSLVLEKHKEKINNTMVMNGECAEWMTFYLYSLSFGESVIKFLIRSWENFYLKNRPQVVD